MEEPQVIFEDDHIFVIEKPPHMTVNRADTTRGEKTVQEWVEEKILRDKDIKILSDKKSSFPNILVSQYPSISDFYRRAGIVHRLDKETSGVLIVAKTPEAFESLQRQFKQRTIEKTYVALVHGEVRPEEGEIRVPVGRLPWNRKRFGVVAGGREAVTKFKVLEHYPCHPEPIRPEGSRPRRLVSGSSTSDVEMPKPFGLAQGGQVRHDSLSLLELYPETGRTHQIRVHLKYFGHPVFSDELYAGRKTARADRKLLPRLFLHSSKISFTHPKTRQRLTFQNPLPVDLSRFLKNYR